MSSTTTLRDRAHTSLGGYGWQALGALPGAASPAATCAAGSVPLRSPPAPGDAPAEKPATPAQLLTSAALQPFGDALPHSAAGAKAASDAHERQRGGEKYARSARAALSERTDPHPALSCPRSTTGPSPRDQDPVRRGLKDTKRSLRLPLLPVLPQREPAGAVRSRVR